MMRIGKLPLLGDPMTERSKAAALTGYAAPPPPPASPPPPVPSVVLPEPSADMGRQFLPGMEQPPELRTVAPMDPRQAVDAAGFYGGPDVGKRGMMQLENLGKPLAMEQSAMAAQQQAAMMRHPVVTAPPDETGAMAEAQRSAMEFMNNQTMKQMGSDELRTLQAVMPTLKRITGGYA